MFRVFVLDTEKKPLTPCRPARARQLLTEGKAAVFRRYPFTIILKVPMPDAVVDPMRVKVDPGSKTTGLAVVSERTHEVVFAAELQHRGQAIKKSLDSRRSIRRSRRNRKTRYRPARFNNRCHPKGWLAPSLQHRVETISTWIERFRRISQVDALSQELVKFDTQLMQNPEIRGVEYQQGELAGYEVREALLEKWNRACAYCGVTNVPLQVEHVHSKARGGSNCFSNLVIACDDCNKRKGTLSVEIFLAEKPKVLARVEAQMRKPLDDAAAMNSTRWALFERLKSTGLLVETGSGGRTKFNRSRLQLPKAHWIDAACVGISGETVNTNSSLKPLMIKATGHGTRQMCGTDKFGFPIRHRSSKSIHYGFQTGDIVRATVSKGKKTGRHEGRVLCRAIGSFDIKTEEKRIAGISYKNCAILHRKDGYAYD